MTTQNRRDTVVARHLDLIVVGLQLFASVFGSHRHLSEKCHTMVYLRPEGFLCPVSGPTLNQKNLPSIIPLRLKKVPTRQNGMGRSHNTLSIKYDFCICKPFVNARYNQSDSQNHQSGHLLPLGQSPTQFSEKSASLAIHPQFEINGRTINPFGNKIQRDSQKSGDVLLK
jgi:hypothetical protein